MELPHVYSISKRSLLAFQQTCAAYTPRRRGCPSPPPGEALQLRSTLLAYGRCRSPRSATTHTRRSHLTCCRGTGCTCRPPSRPRRPRRARTSTSPSSSPARACAACFGARSIPSTRLSTHTRVRCSASAQSAAHTFAPHAHADNGTGRRQDGGVQARARVSDGGVAPRQERKGGEGVGARAQGIGQAEHRGQGGATHTPLSTRGSLAHESLAPDPMAPPARRLGHPLSLSPSLPPSPSLSHLSFLSLTFVLSRSLAFPPSLPLRRPRRSAARPPSRWRRPASRSRASRSRERRRPRPSPSRSCCARRRPSSRPSATPRPSATTTRAASASTSPSSTTPTRSSSAPPRRPVRSRSLPPSPYHLLPLLLLLLARATLAACRMPHAPLLRGRANAYRPTRARAATHLSPSRCAPLLAPFPTISPSAADLLERSRVVEISNGERNYHIFYQLLTDEAVRSKWGLDRDASNHMYLSSEPPFVEVTRMQCNAMHAALHALLFAPRMPDARPTVLQARPFCAHPSVSSLSTRRI